MNRWLWKLEEETEGTGQGYRHGWVGGICKRCAENICSYQECDADRLCVRKPGKPLGDCKPRKPGGEEGCAPSKYGCTWDGVGQSGDKGLFISYTSFFVQEAVIFCDHYLLWLIT